MMKTHFALLALAVLLAACGNGGEPRWQGYAEGEYVDIGSPMAGRLDRLLVHRGQTIDAGTALYAIDDENDRAALTQAQAQRDAAIAQRADLEQGKRPPELAVIRAQLAQARAAAREANLAAKRDETQRAEGVIAQAQWERSRAAADSAQAHVEELQRQLEVAQLGGREQQLKALDAQIEAAKAAVTQAQWRLDRQSPKATRAALVVDTLFDAGEWVGAGQPVLRLLPPEARKFRFFVPEPDLARVAIGQSIAVRCDGVADSVAATVDYISPTAEYTPPVIFSEQTRAKLVYRVEARPDRTDAPCTHPGQPVTVIAR